MSILSATWNNYLVTWCEIICIVKYFNDISYESFVHRCEQDVLFIKLKNIL